MTPGIGAARWCGGRKPGLPGPRASSAEKRPRTGHSEPFPDMDVPLCPVLPGDPGRQFRICPQHSPLFSVRVSPARPPPFSTGGRSGRSRRRRRRSFQPTASGRIRAGDFSCGAWRRAWVTFASPSRSTLRSGRSLSRKRSRKPLIFNQPPLASLRRSASFALLCSLAGTHEKQIAPAGSGCVRGRTGAVFLGGIWHGSRGGNRTRISEKHLTRFCNLHGYNGSCECIVNTSCAFL